MPYVLNDPHNGQLNKILEALVPIQLSVSTAGSPAYNILYSYPYMPADPSNLVCPFFINGPKPGPSDITATAGAQYIETAIIMDLCVTPDQKMANQAALLQRIHWYRDAVFVAFAGKLKLGGALPFVLQARILRYVPLVKVSIGTSDYLGSEFELTVQELYPMTVTL
jgi:hypothetical protein